MKWKRIVMILFFVVAGIALWNVHSPAYFSETVTSSYVELTLNTTSSIQVVTEKNTSDIRMTAVSYLNTEKAPAANESFVFQAGNSKIITATLAKAGLGIPGYVFTHSSQLTADSLRVVRYAKAETITIALTSLTETPFTVVHSQDETGPRMMSSIIICVLLFAGLLWMWFIPS